MIMKGGILLAIHYRSGRFTTDVDFSTSKRIQDVQVPELLKQFEECLAPVSAENEYGLAIALQSHVLKPPNRPEVTFPTLKITIGYAKKSERSQIDRLKNKAAAKTVQIDYSFNEWSSDIEKVSLDGGTLAVYPLLDLVAEKLRSVLQQPIRRRARYQDIYDLFILLHEHNFSEHEKKLVLGKLQASAIGRLDRVNKEGMRDDEVVRWSRMEYDSALPPLISSKPPDFNIAYGAVREFYESLPWAGPEPGPE